MWGFLWGGAIGYALGCRAGREQTSQVVRASGRLVRGVLDHPAVQGAAGVASAKLSELSGGKRQRNRRKQRSRRRRG